MAVDAEDSLSCTASTAKTNGLRGNDRGVERHFPELSKTPRPYSSLSNLRRARLAAALVEVWSLASLCPYDTVSNKQISFWLSSEGTSGGRGDFLKESLPRY